VDGQLTIIELVEEVDLQQTEFHVELIDAYTMDQ
jgi:hypothetical protein